MKWTQNKRRYFGSQIKCHENKYNNLNVRYIVHYEFKNVYNIIYKFKLSNIRLSKYVGPGTPENLKTAPHLAWVYIYLNKLYR